MLVDIPICLGDTLADWLQAGGLILGVDGLREDTARYFWIDWVFHSQVDTLKSWGTKMHT